MEDKNIEQFDSRLIHQRIRDGKVTKKDFKKHLESLSDMEANSEEIVIEEDVAEHTSNGNSQEPTFEVIEVSEED